MSRPAPTPPDLTRPEFETWLKSAGLDPEQITELHIDRDGIRATVLDVDDSGRPIIDVENGEGFKKHTVFVPVRELEATQ